MFAPTGDRARPGRERPATPPIGCTRAGQDEPGTAGRASHSQARPPSDDADKITKWRKLLRERRESWHTPALDTLQRPALSTARRIGLLTLRGYLLFAIVIVALKLVQATAGH